MNQPRAWPEAPNTFIAVTSTLPTLGGILAAFVSGYFAAVVVSDATILSETYILAPALYPDWAECPVDVQRAVPISSVCVAALIVMLGSIIQSIAALMLKYDLTQYDGPENPPDAIQKSWKVKRQSATARALILFHISLPLMSLSLALILNGWLLTLLLYAIFFWLAYTGWSCFQEFRSSGYGASEAG